MRKGTFWRRLRRILVLSLCYWMFASLTIGFDLPFVPFRRRSRRVDFWVLMASGAALLMLMFFVVDTALRTRQVANLFAQQPVQWPQPCLQSTAAKAVPWGRGERMAGDPIPGRGHGKRPEIHLLSVYCAFRDDCGPFHRRVQLADRPLVDLLFECPFGL